MQLFWQTLTVDQWAAMTVDQWALMELCPTALTTAEAAALLLP